jgi:hypothetical protein
LGEVTGVGIRDQTKGVVAECELGVAEEGLVGGGDQAAGHFEDGGGGSGLDACRQFLGLGFEFRAERFGHDRLLPR